MTPNVRLLRETMNQILARPELHDQAFWAIRTDCGTAHCFAGWACVLSGVDVEPLKFIGADTMYTLDGDTIMDEAQRALGLDHYSAMRLFEGHNTTADIKHMVDEIADQGFVTSRPGDDADPWLA